LLTIKEILENFFYGMGAVGLFLLFFMGTFGSMPSFEDLENQTLTLQPKSFRQMVWF
jgi:hypothetical protein